MFWYVSLGVVGALVLLSVASATTRRLWLFGLYAAKYLVLLAGDRIGLRRMRARLMGRDYLPLTGPLALRLFCEDMGPTFIKFGQIVASSAGMFPAHYTLEFQKVLDRVRSFPFHQVTEIVREELGDRAAELGEIDPEPLAAASIAQVHTATLADGERVVLKVQRPGIQRLIAADVRLMKAVARVAARLFPRRTEFINPVGFVADFAATLREELDFRKEAENLDRFNDIMRELAYKDVRAPVPNWALTSARLLVMERFMGTRVDDEAGIRGRGLDGEEKLVHGLRAWFQCVVYYGFFHGDVHAGNLMLLDTGDLGFLDFGIVGRFDDRQRRLVTEYVVAFATGDYKTLAQVIVEMGGVAGSEIDMARFQADLKQAYSPLLTLAFGELNYADMLPGINKVARDHRMVMPREFILILKQMLYFDRYAKILAPKLNVFSDPRLVMGLLQDVQKVRAESAAAAGQAAGRASSARA
ncbi:MAG TPA: AarF/UbiB family protein [Kofleriaceae bacterium]|nr:AarF/UbiB family protein [Kofleriaceae bacterium]